MSGSGENAGRLADLDQVAVGVSNVRADLASMILRLGEELGALRRPFLVGLGNVGDANVEECARAVGVRRRSESHGGLVVRRTATDIEDQPGVRNLHDDRVALEENLAVEQRSIELTGPVLVGNHQKVRNDETAFRRGKVLRVHLTSSTLSFVSSHSDQSTGSLLRAWSPPSSPTDERHLRSHHGHELNVGIEGEARHVQDRAGYMLDVKSWLDLDIPVRLHDAL